MSATRCYCGGELVGEGFPVSEISEWAAEPGTTVWADFTSPTAEDLADIEAELGLHHLAVEDAVTHFERAKIDRYDTHLFLVAYDAFLPDRSAELSTTAVKAFIAPNAVVTVHGPEFDMGRVVQRWDHDPDLARHGVAFLLWGLLDEIVDRHFDAVQQLDGELERLEDVLFDERPRPREVQRRSFELRKSLVLLRRVVLSMREVVNTLMRRDLEAFDEQMQPYFVDVYDHVLRATEWTDSLRDLVTTILETNVGIQGNRMNLIMKKVTSWAAIIAVPTAITGFYGQNLPYPGSGTAAGFWTSTALILALSIALYVGFKKKDWI